MNLTSLLTVFVSAVLVGMSAAAIPPIVRALPPIQEWTQRGIKPWACDLCMSFWSTVVMTAVWCALGVLPIAGLPAFVVTFAIVRFNSEPIGPPPGFPELVDSGEPALAE